MLSHPIYPELDFDENPVKAVSLMLFVPSWVLLFRLVLVLYDAICALLLEPETKGQAQKRDESSLSENLHETMSSILPWDESVL